MTDSGWVVTVKRRTGPLLAKSVGGFGPCSDSDNQGVLVFLTSDDAKDELAAMPDVTPGSFEVREVRVEILGLDGEPERPAAVRPCENKQCFSGVVFCHAGDTPERKEHSSGRVKVCHACKTFKTNIQARRFVQAVLEVYADELAARGGAPEEVLERLRESPGLLAEHLAERACSPEGEGTPNDPAWYQDDPLDLEPVRE